MASYTTDIPQAPQSLGETQQPILNNFNAIYDGFRKNHEPLAGTNAGKHTIVQMTDQADPGGTANMLTFYNKIISTVPQLFMESQGNRVYQISKFDDANFSHFGQFIALNAPTIFGGWTFLPGGLILQYGQITGVTANVVFTIPYTTVYAFFCSNSLSGSVSTTGFTVNSTAGQPYFIVIGV